MSKTVTPARAGVVYEVEVVQRVRVSLDPDRFTPEFMSEFRRNFYPLEDLGGHAEHIAQLAARGAYELADYAPGELVEGYGPIGEMGISAEVLDCETDVLSGPSPGPSDTAESQP